MARKAFHEGKRGGDGSARANAGGDRRARRDHGHIDVSRADLAKVGIGPGGDGEAAPALPGSFWRRRG
jgi:hypothetical protein